MPQWKLITWSLEHAHSENTSLFLGTAPPYCHGVAIQDPTTAPLPSHDCWSDRNQMLISSIWSFIYLFIVNFSMELRKLISFFPVVELIRSVALFPTKANTKMSICLGSQHSPSWSGSECFWTICHRLRFMAPHSSTLAWKIPWLEEPGGLQSMGSLQVEHDWATSFSLFTLMHRRRKWQPTPVFLPGESQGRGSLVGCHLWGRTESEKTEAT